MTIKKTIYFVVWIILLGGLCFSVALAAEFRINKKGGNIILDEIEKVKNLYAAGNMISIDSDVEKSLYVGGNVITINGDVEGQYRFWQLAN